jgi:hypothetical protein
MEVLKPLALRFRAAAPGSVLDNVVFQWERVKLFQDTDQIKTPQPIDIKLITIRRVP